MDTTIGDYLDRVAALIESAIDVDDVVQYLKFQKEEISELASISKTTEIWNDSQERFKSYIEIIEKGRTPDERVQDAFNQFTYKINTAPTQMHLTGAVILNIPVLEHFINSALEVEQHNCDE